MKGQSQNRIWGILSDLQEMIGDDDFGMRLLLEELEDEFCDLECTIEEEKWKI